MYSSSISNIKNIFLIGKQEVVAARLEQGPSAFVDQNCVFTPCRGRLGRISHPALISLCYLSLTTDQTGRLFHPGPSPPVFLPEIHPTRKHQRSRSQLTCFGQGWSSSDRFPCPFVASGMCKSHSSKLGPAAGFTEGMHVRADAKQLVACRFLRDSKMGNPISSLHGLQIFPSSLSGRKPEPRISIDPPPPSAIRPQGL